MPQSSSPAFSLVELLTALAVMAVLTAAVLTVPTAHLSARARAKAELAVLAQALESFRHEFGDYPQTGGCPPLVLDPTIPGVPTWTAEVKLFNALIGRLGPALEPLSARCRIDLARLSFVPGAALPSGGSSGEIANAFTDPWGRPYVYCYRAPGSGRWDAAAYVLYSAGPDGADVPPTFGIGDPAAAGNIDNVYPNS